jgi:hypothetical protein
MAHIINVTGAPCRSVSPCRSVVSTMHKPPSTLPAPDVFARLIGHATAGPCNASADVLRQMMMQRHGAGAPVSKMPLRSSAGLTRPLLAVTVFASAVAAVAAFCMWQRHG